MLDYLDRHNGNPSSSSSTSSSVSCLNERSANVLYTTTAAATTTTLTRAGNEVSGTILEETAANNSAQPVSRYERFPYLRNSRDKSAVDQSRKFVPHQNANANSSSSSTSTSSSATNTGSSTTSNFKRTQSNSSIQARQNQNLVNVPLTSAPRSMFSASVDRLNAVNVRD